MTWHSPPSASRRPPQVRVVQLDEHALCALADGDLERAERSSPVRLSAYLAGPECREVWRRRRDQVRQDPATAAWVTGVVWDETHAVAVGRAGFHDVPDASGMVEIGYAIDPASRRRGYARAALEQLLDRATEDASVRVVRLSIRPDNAASTALALQYGFAVVGEQWDEEDGREIVYERQAEPWVRLPTPDA